MHVHARTHGDDIPILLIILGQSRNGQNFRSLGRVPRIMTKKKWSFQLNSEALSF